MPKYVVNVVVSTDVRITKKLIKDMVRNSIEGSPIVDNKGRTVTWAQKATVRSVDED